MRTRAKVHQVNNKFNFRQKDKKLAISILSLTLLHSKSIIDAVYLVLEELTAQAELCVVYDCSLTHTLHAILIVCCSLHVSVANE